MSGSLSANSSSEFEEELVSDDLFLSYFNAFLRLPPVQTTEMQTPEYGLSDRERESIIKWAKSERYVSFKRSDYYRELKLCRLLRCPTEFIPGGKELLAPKVFGDLFHSGNTSAIRGLAGVSRQSSFAHDTESMEECSEMTEESDLTGGSEVSRGTPSEQQQSFDDLWIQEDKGRKRDHTYGKYFKIRRQTVPGSPEQFSPVLESRLSGKANNIPEYVASAGSVGKSRRMSDPVLVQRGTSSEKHRRSPENPQTDDSNHFKRAECWVQRKEAEKSTSDSFVTATESELVQQLESFQKRQHIPFQRLKELLLSSRDGMRDFISFLGPTKGLSLVDFWLDCEETTMSVAHLQISERLRTKFQLLRELEDRYILRLTPKVRRHLELAIDTLSNEIVKNCQSDEDHLTQRIGELMFERIQYDSLRRLRSYWLPSWILHWESRLKRCQFLPSGHGGCQLFYIPPKRFKTSRSELQEGGFNDALTGFSDENINGLPDEKKEEQDWDKEVSEQILAKALSGTGLFGVKESRKVLRESRTSRVYLTATSTLDSIPESRVGGLLREYTPNICDVETKKEVFDEIHLGSAVSWESTEVFGCMDVSSNAKQRRKSICSSRNNLPESVTLQTPYKKQNVSNRKSISAQEWRAFRILLMDSAAGGPLQLYLERLVKVFDKMISVV
ncbi:hypothetical protein X801_03163 [Opisthorchis viverrini]|uniref:Uncharacterized protein n=2 Tax=Opisthorchis viverrini TaxID=6198 RepID=A0A1S8X2P7_OPIVI|nr:hypothetical protein T265_08608 [Opisthorchis viverrini]KER23529.1 hypothetical protein T265_08608 [Opisthorchis viverrini]OON20946.1 hypothetical protein X801_03163 [Opisthorchis viverrini]